MTFLLQAVDADDETVLWDFQDPTGAANPYGVMTWFGLDGQFTLTPAEMEAVSFAPSIMDGRRTVQSRVRGRQVSWPQRILAPDYDSLVSAIGELAEIFRRGPTLRWQPDGSSASRWIDCNPSLSPAVFGGQPLGLHLVVEEFDTALGVPLLLDCQPYLRGPFLTSGTNRLADSLMLRDRAMDGRPDNFAWDSTTNITDEEIDAVEQAYRFTIATASVRNLEQTTAPASAAPSDVWSLSVYVRAASGTSAEAQIVGRYLDNTATPVAAEEAGTLTPVTGSWQRLTLTMAAAPAGTDRVQVSIRFDDFDANPNVVLVRWAQAEIGTVSTFVPNAETMTNDPSLSGYGSTIPIQIHGNAWAPVALTLRSPDASAKVQEYLVARRSTGGENSVKQVVTYLNFPVSQSESGTLYNNTAIADDPEASTGTTANVAECSYTSDPTVMKRRVRSGLFITPEAMRGTWDVWLRCRATAASVQVLQLRWAASFLDPVPNSNTEVTFDTSEVAAFPFVMLYVGNIALPYDFDSLQGVAAEVWARRTSGTGNLRMDYLAFVPVDDPEPSVTRILAPARSEESWIGTQLVTPPVDLGAGDPTWVAGDLVGDDLRLNAVNEGGGSPPNAGAPWPVGHQRATFRFQPGTNGGVFTMKLRIVNVTDSTEVVTRVISVTNATVLENEVLECDTVAGKSYQIQAVLTAWSNGHVRIRSIEHQTIPYLGQEAGIYTDPETGMVARLTSANEFTTRLESRGPIPLWCPPGLTVVYVHAIDIPILGYEQGESVKGRTWAASITYAPRYWT